MYFDLTTSLQIQKILTVSDEDLSPEDIDAMELDDDLGAALDKALPTWEVVAADVTKPANQRRLRLFAKYFCAGTVALTAQVFVLKQVSDGSNQAQRSDKDGWKFLAEGFLARAQSIMLEITDDLGVSPAPTVAFSMVSRVTPDRDPITTPRAVANAS